MNCERCEQRPAEMHYTEIREGKAHKLQICSACAQALGFETETPSPPTIGEAPPQPPGKIVGVVSVTAQVGAAQSSPLDDVCCPACGMSGADLRTQSLFGCPECYEVFDELLDPVLRRLHGAVQHRGRLPHGESSDRIDLDRLRRDLREAISEEDFERAARVRDRLRRARPSAGDPEARP